MLSFFSVITYRRTMFSCKLERWAHYNGSSWRQALDLCGPGNPKLCIFRPQLLYRCIILRVCKTESIGPGYYVSRYPIGSYLLDRNGSVARIGGTRLAPGGRSPPQVVSIGCPPPPKLD